MTALDKLRLELDAAKSAAALVADRINEIERVLGEISGPVYEADEGLLAAAILLLDAVEGLPGAKLAAAREVMRLAIHEHGGELSALAVAGDGIPF